MTRQLHTRFSTEEVEMLLQKRLDEKVELVYILEMLAAKRTRSFKFLKQCRSDPDHFSIQYRRKGPTRKISRGAEKIIINELRWERKKSQKKDLVSEKGANSVVLRTGRQS